MVAGSRINKNHKAHRYLSRELYDSDINNAPSLELPSTHTDSPIIFADRLQVEGKGSRLSPSSRVIPDDSPSPASSTYATSLYAAESGTYPTFHEGVGKASEDTECESNAPSSVVFCTTHPAIPEQEPRFAATSGNIVRTHSKSRSSTYPRSLHLLAHGHAQEFRGAYVLRDLKIVYFLTFGGSFCSRCESLYGHIMVCGFS
jgi:hypothetical protein